MDITENQEHEVFDLPSAEDLADTDEAKQDAEFDRPYIPRGRIPGVLQDIDTTPSKKDKPMTTWTFAIADGYAEGRTLKTYLLIERPYQLRKMVDAVGLEAESNGGIAFTNPKHRGHRCILQIGDSKQMDKNGNPFAELKGVQSDTTDSKADNNIPF